MTKDKYLKNLYQYEVFIDAEGRCENYSVCGYVCADDWHQAKDYMRRMYENNGEKVIRVDLNKNYALCDIAHR